MTDTRVQTLTRSTTATVRKCPNGWEITPETGRQRIVTRDEIETHGTVFRGISCPEAWLAALVARHDYGRRGVVATLRQDASRRDGTLTNWEAYIGVRTPDGAVAGHGLWLHVTYRSPPDSTV